MKKKEEERKRKKTEHIYKTHIYRLHGMICDEEDGVCIYV